MFINGKSELFDIYTRPAVYCPVWCKEQITFQEIFFRPSSSNIFPMFSLYRDEGQMLRRDVVDYYGKPNYKWHALDFERHQVHILISEFDKSKEYKQVDEQEHQRRGQLVQISGVTYDELAYGKEEYLLHHNYAVELFNKLTTDKRILFVYLTGSGLGLRFALYSQQRLTKEKYEQTNKIWSELLWQQYDSQRRLRLDPNVFSGDVTWWLPKYPNYTFVNSRCQMVR